MWTSSGAGSSHTSRGPAGALREARRHRVRARPPEPHSCGVPMSPSEPPAEVQAGFPLARLATIRTGGSADYFARVGGEAELLELLAWALLAKAPVSVVGSGSNLLIADEGVGGRVVRLVGELGRVEDEGQRMVCG